jgi:membrane fusion protein, multidrug efflux system
MNENWKLDVLRTLKSRPARITGMVLVSLFVLRIGVNFWLHRAPLILAQSVRVAPIELKTIDKTLNLPGNVEAIEQATLFAHVSGYLKKLLVDEGDKVKKNQLLAVIDAPDVMQEYSNAKADWNFKEVTRKRYQELLQDKVVSQQEYDKMQAEAEQAKARFDNAAANVQYTEVRAPFAGSIARRFRYPGDFISAPAKGGQPSALFMLVNEETLRIVVNVPQSEVANAGIGHPVEIRVDAFPEEKFDGAISRIDALLDEATKTQRVLIDIKNLNIQLRAGMFASVVMRLEHRENVPMISKDAIHREEDKAYVFLVLDKKAKKTPVTTGDTQPGMIEIKSPTFAANDLLVVSGGNALADGDSVKVESTPSSKSSEPPAQESPISQALADPNRK